MRLPRGDGQAASLFLASGAGAKLAVRGRAGKRPPRGHGAPARLPPVKRYFRPSGGFGASGQPAPLRKPGLEQGCLLRRRGACHTSATPNSPITEVLTATRRLLTLPPLGASPSPFAAVGPPAGSRRFASGVKAWRFTVAETGPAGSPRIGNSWSLPTRLRA